MKIRRRQVVDMTLRGGHGPHTADWRATRDKEMLEVDMSDDALVTELWETREEVCRLRHELKRLRDDLDRHAHESEGDLFDDLMTRVLTRYARRVNTILQGDNHE